MALSIDESRKLKGGSPRSGARREEDEEKILSLAPGAEASRHASPAVVRSVMGFSGATRRKASLPVTGVEQQVQFREAGLA